MPAYNNNFTFIKWMLACNIHVYNDSRLEFHNDQSCVLPLQLWHFSFVIVMQDNGKADGIHREIYHENGSKPTLMGNHGLC